MLNADQFAAHLIANDSWLRLFSKDAIAMSRLMQEIKMRFSAGRPCDYAFLLSLYEKERQRAIDNSSTDEARGVTRSKYPDRRHHSMLRDQTSRGYFA